jgi:hypothetical protein
MSGLSASAKLHTGRSLISSAPLPQDTLLDRCLFSLTVHARNTRTGLINPYPARPAASIVALAAFNVAWVSRAILPFAIKLRSLAFRVVVE